MTTVSFTGHRPNKLGGYKIPNPIYSACYGAIHDALLYLKTDKAISGMALGVDTWGAQNCIDLDIPFVAAVPFKGQESIWPKESQDTYNTLLSAAEHIEYICEPGYQAWKLQQRNKWMVDNSDIVLAVFDGTPGGTKNCIDYALLNNKKVLKIDPIKDFLFDWYE